MRQTKACYGLFWPSSEPRLLWGLGYQAHAEVVGASKEGYSYVPITFVGAKEPGIVCFRLQVR